VISVKHFNEKRRGGSKDEGRGKKDGTTLLQLKDQIVKSHLDNS